MNQQTRTLLLHATNIPNTKRIITDTIREGLRIDLDRMPFLKRNGFMRGVFKQGYRYLSYVMDWYEAFAQSPLLRIDACNINNLFQLVGAMRRIETYPLIIILHSAAGDHMRTLRWYQSAFQKRKGRLVICFGNEYALMSEKISFAKSVEADFIVTQLPLKSAQWLYSDCTRSALIAAPAALNSTLYCTTGNARTVDIGFRGSMYSHSIGDNQRAWFLSRIKEAGISLGLHCDMEYEMLERRQWADFLNTCHGIPGVEAGTRYLEKTDRTQKAVKRYLQQYPRASFDDVNQMFFKDYSGAISGKAISSRHFEPIGTQTCQILLEGEYNGILKADEHYIVVKKDLSNLEEAIRKFNDVHYRQTIIKKSYDYVMSAHTYRHRVETILKAVL